MYNVKRIFKLAAIALAVSSANLNAFTLEGTVFDRVGKEMNVDPVLLYSVALTESALSNGGKQIAPNPYTLRTFTTPYYFKEKEQALDKLNQLARTHKSIDVGLMQINIKYHADKFNSFDELLDIEQNVRIGAEILKEVMASTSNKIIGIGRYHSYTPERADYYGRKVLAVAKQVRQIEAKAIKEKAKEEELKSQTAENKDLEPKEIIKEKTVAKPDIKEVLEQKDSITPPKQVESLASETNNLDNINDIKVASEEAKETLESKKDLIDDVKKEVKENLVEPKDNLDNIKKENLTEIKEPKEITTEEFAPVEDVNAPKELKETIVNDEKEPKVETKIEQEDSAKSKIEEDVVDYPKHVKDNINVAIDDSLNVNLEQRQIPKVKPLGLATSEDKKQVETLGLASLDDKKSVIGAKKPIFEHPSDFFGGLEKSTYKEEEPAGLNIPETETKIEDLSKLNLSKEDKAQVENIVNALKKSGVVKDSDVDSKNILIEQGKELSHKLINPPTQIKEVKDKLNGLIQKQNDFSNAFDNVK